MATLLSGLLFAGASAAQEAEPDMGGDVVLDPITVTAAASGLAAGTTEGTGLYAAPFTNTATKFALTPRETPQTVTVVTDQLIEDFNLTNMVDVLEAAPGVNVYVERSPGVFVANSRGIAEFNTQFDGIPGSGAIIGRAVIPFDTAFVDRTEILSGPQGLLVGAGGSGGVINIVRKMPASQRLIAAEATVDERGSYRLVGDLSGPLNASGSLRGRVIGVLDDDQSFVDDVWYRTGAIYGVLEADVRDGTTVAIGGMYADYDARPGASYGNPANLDGSFADLPRSANLGATWATDTRTAEMLFANLAQDLAGDWEFRGALNYVRGSQRLTEANPAGPFYPGTDHEYRIYAQKEGWDETAYGLDAYAAGTAEFGGRRHDLMAGVNAQRIDGSSIGGYTVPGLPDLPGVVQISHAFDHDPGRVPKPADSDWTESWGASEETIDQFGAYAGGRFSLSDAVSLFLGGRATRWSYDSDDASADHDAFTPYAALTYDVTSWGTVYASYSTIFQPEEWALDANLQPLAPVEGHGYEIGAKGAFLDDRLNASLALFRLDQKNLPVED